MHNPSSETRLLTNSPTMSYREIWSLGGLSIRKFVIELIRKFGRLQISARSASLAYYALFSTAPLLILILAVSAMLPIEHLIETTLQAVEAGMPDNVANMVRLQLNEMEGTINLTLTLGSAFLLMRTVLVTMIALVFGPQVIRYFLQELQLDWMQSPTYPFARWGLLAGFMLVASSLLYWIVPSVKVGYYLISPGSLVATIGTVTATIGLGYYVDSFYRFNEIYGTLGGIAALMMWFHLTGLFLLTGGLINGIIHRAVVASKVA